MATVIPARLGAPSTTPAELGGSQLLAVASSQPDLVVTAAALGEPFGRSAAWIHTRTGIDELRRIDPESGVEEPSRDLAVSAARAALVRAGVAADDIDLVIIASCSTGPEVGASVAAATAGRAGWMAVNSACSGFCYALSAADNLVRTGAARTVLIVAVEQMSALLDPTDLATSILFGDGAGAAVVGRASADAAGIGPMVSGSDGARSALIACRPDGRLEMAGRDVFRWAIETVPDLVRETARRSGIELTDLAAFVPHQANRRIIEAVAERLGLPEQIVASDVSRSGNTSAASIPIALDRLLIEQPELSGRHALLFGFGAGLSYAGQVIKLP